jgi:hypothetical protein
MMNIILESARTPVWANTEHTAIDLIVKFGHLPNEVPFTASANDSEAHGREIFAAAAEGQFGAVAEKPARTPS